jgi:AraC family transcriptional regulator
VKLKNNLFRQIVFQAFAIMFMNQALPIGKFLEISRDKYESKKRSVSRFRSEIYSTIHHEIADSDLLHFPENSHICFIVEGIISDKRKRFEFERASGELMFFQSGEPHQTVFNTFPAKHITIELDSDFFHTNETSESRLETFVKKDPTAKFIMLRILKEVILSDEFSECSIEMLLLNLIKGNDAAQNKRPKWIDQVSDLVNDCWNYELNISDLAASANVHPKTISKYFPKYFGCTLGECRRKLKVERSISLIKSSKLSLTEIAYECDFFDQSHFTKTFKNLTGFSPKQFQLF